MMRKTISIVFLVAAVLTVLAWPSGTAQACKVYDTGCEYCDTPYYQIGDEICITRSWVCWGGGGSDTWCW